MCHIEYICNNLEYIHGAPRKFVICFLVFFHERMILVQADVSELVLVSELEFSDLVSDSASERASELASESGALGTILPCGILRDLFNGRCVCDVALAMEGRTGSWELAPFRSDASDARESAMDAMQSVMVRPSLDFAYDSSAFTSSAPASRKSPNSSALSVVYAVVCVFAVRSLPLSLPLSLLLGVVARLVPSNDVAVVPSDAASACWLGSWKSVFAVFVPPLPLRMESMLT